MVSGHNSELPSDSEESIVHAGVAGCNLVIAEAAASIDVPTFNLSFVLSSSDKAIKYSQTTVPLKCLCKVR